MAEDQNNQRPKPEQGDKFIPPPMDPYATYQTPYEPRKSPEPNPFIEFRRFADKQMSEVFSAFPIFGNLANIFGVEEGVKSFREQLEKDMKDMLAHQKRMEDFIESNKNNPGQDEASTIHPNFSSATKHASPDAGHPGRFITATTSDGKSYRIDAVTGQATEQSLRADTQVLDDAESRRARWKRGFKKCPELKQYQVEVDLDEDKTSSRSATQNEDERESRQATWRRGFRNCPELRNYQGEVEVAAAEESPQSNPQTEDDSDSRQAILKRGFKNCPELRKYQGETELDVYESLEAQVSPPESLYLSTKPSSSWSSWLPTYGFDGKRRSKQSADSTTRSGHDSSDRPCDITTYYDRQSGWMDPFERDRDFLPWLFLSQYSPLFLTKPELRPLKSVQLHNGCEDEECHEPMRVIDHDLQEKSLSAKETQMRNSLSDHLPWAEAFEDLISLEKTGQMPERDVEGREPSHEMTRRWLRGMVDRGLLGSNWWLEDDSVMRSTRSPHQSPRAHMSPISIEKIAQEYLDSVTSARDEIRRTLDASRNEPDTHQTHEPREQQPDSTPAATSNALIRTERSPREVQKSTSKPSIISTLTTMTSRTLPDGSVETKRVLKTRFADGKEESEESTELVHPQAPTSSSKGSSEPSKRQSDKPGWFWT